MASACSRKWEEKCDTLYLTLARRPSRGIIGRTCTETSSSREGHTMSAPAATSTDKKTGFVRGLGLVDSTTIVAGSMIGSGIFIVSAEMSRQVGSPGWLLVAWAITGVLTVVGALSYGELAAMMPKAGGQYVYLREAFSPLWGFLYGWTLFMVIQTGTIAAVAVGFARYFGVLWPTLSESNYIVKPIHLGSSYAVSLSTAQLVGLFLIALLTWMNTRGLRLGKFVQKDRKSVV